MNIEVKFTAETQRGRAATKETANFANYAN
jgi:hypothetical protein